MIFFDIGRAPVFAGSLVASFLAGGAAGIGALRFVKTRLAAGAAEHPRRRALVGYDRPPRTDASMLGDVAPFVDYLAEMPLARWLEIGRALDADREGVAARVTSWAILEATIATNRLGVSAWYVSDAIGTAAFLAKGSARRLGRRDRRAFTAAAAAAEHAALAMLARSHLAPVDLDLLCEPFADALASEFGAASTPLA